MRLFRVIRGGMKKTSPKAQKKDGAIVPITHDDEDQARRIRALTEADEVTIRIVTAELKEIETNRERWDSNVMTKRIKELRALLPKR